MEDESGLFSSANDPWYYDVVKKIVCTGAIPEHIAIIMDGNRRYARANGLCDVIRGHTAGFDRLSKVLRWSADIGVREVTVYAFSIENFNRSKNEVDGLMDLFERKLRKVYEQRCILAEKQITVRFFGDLSCLPPVIQSLMAKIELYTMNFNKGAFNICVAYTAQDEIKRAITTIRSGVKKGLITEDDIDEELINNCLDTRNSRDLDMLIRTSGEQRLSDFLLWQCSYCYIHFDKSLWPDFTFCKFCVAIIHYQINVRRIPDVRSCIRRENFNDELADMRIKHFLSWITQNRHAQLQKMSINDITFSDDQT